VYKKDWQNALVDDTFSSLSNGIGVKELCHLNFFVMEYKFKTCSLILIKKKG